MSSNMAKVACCCNVSYEWIATGRGPLTLSDEAEVLAVEIDFHLYAQSELERRLLTAFRDVSYPGNRGLVELLEALAGGGTVSLADADLPARVTGQAHAVPSRGL